MVSEAGHAVSSPFAVPHIVYLSIPLHEVNGRMLGLRAPRDSGPPNTLLPESRLGLVPGACWECCMRRRAVGGLLRGSRQDSLLPRWGLRGAGALPHTLAACGALSPSGTSCKPETLFQGTEGSEPGDGGQTTGTTQQPRVHGVALPGLGRAKGWSFDGKQEVRGAQGGDLRVLWAPVYHPPLPIPRLWWVSGEMDALVLKGVGCSPACVRHVPGNPGRVTYPGASASL